MTLWCTLTTEKQVPLASHCFLRAAELLSHLQTPQDGAAMKSKAHSICTQEARVVCAETHQTTSEL